MKFTIKIALNFMESEKYGHSEDSEKSKCVFARQSPPLTYLLFRSHDHRDRIWFEDVEELLGDVVVAQRVLEAQVELVPAKRSKSLLLN